MKPDEPQKPSGGSSQTVHVYDDIEEEDNQWWDEKENAWRRIWDDTEASGFSLEASVYDDKQAVKIARNFLRKKKCNTPMPA